MQYSKTVGQEDSDIDITPMLDVVFIMLIFFIVTASFVSEKAIPVNVPPLNQASTIQSLPIVVKITDLQEIRIQNRIVDARAVKANIVRLRAENPEATVVVRVDEKAKTNLLIQAVDGIRAARVEMPSVSLVRS
jgi:biopolymer transport protein ExbD